MRLSHEDHTEQPWRIHDLTRDFRLADVWAFRTPGAGPEDFARVLRAMDAAGGYAVLPLAVRFLFATRWKLGAVFGLDTSKAGLGERVPSLRDRLPSDLQDRAGGSASGTSSFITVYELDNECARELANKTVHAVMHLGWVPVAGGDHELRMAVLVKPNGLLGWFYMAAIAPFRYLVVYPALTRQWERAWLTVGGRLTRAPPRESETVRRPWFCSRWMRRS